MKAIDDLYGFGLLILAILVAAGVIHMSLTAIGVVVLILLACQSFQEGRERGR